MTRTYIVAFATAFFVVVGILALLDRFVPHSYLPQNLGGVGGALIYWLGCAVGSAFDKPEDGALDTERGKHWELIRAVRSPWVLIGIAAAGMVGFLHVSHDIALGSVLGLGGLGALLASGIAKLRGSRSTTRG
jgi:hypothetical protein